MIKNTYKGLNRKSDIGIEVKTPDILDAFV